MFLRDKTGFRKYFEPPEVSVVSFLLRYQQAAEESNAEKKRGVSISQKHFEQHTNGTSDTSYMCLEIPLT